MDIIYQILSMIGMMGVIVPRWVWSTLILITLVILLYTIYRRYVPTTPSSPPVDRTAVLQSPASPTDTDETHATRYQLNQWYRSLLKQLRSHVVGRDYRYEVPWLMIIGEGGAGKTSLLAHTQLNLPLGAPIPSTVGCEAWLFDKGLVMDVSSRYILKPETLTLASREAVIASYPPPPRSDDKGWRTLLELLRRHRPRRPLDGIILTIPCGDLLGLQPNLEVLTKKADHLYHKLWQAQKVLGLRLPVYILITQTDKITGFTDFCAALPEQLRHNIFGWSNPYTLDTTYKSVWLEEAFQKIYRDLNQFQVELVAALNDIPNSDTVLLFPHQFRPVFRHLKIYLDNLFQPSIYHENMFLRGIYFCGDALGDNVTLVHESLALSDHLDFKPILEEKLQTQQIVFLHHLFRDKIFPEAQIARPVTLALRQQTRTLRLAQVSLATIAFLGVFGQWWAYQRLTQDQETLLPLLRESYKDLLAVKVVQSHKTTQVAAQKETNYLQFITASRFLGALAKTNHDQFYSVFLPPSWISHLNSRIIEALTSIYQSFMPEMLYQKLQEKMITLLNPGVTFSSLRSSNLLLDDPEFVVLRQLLEALQEWQTNVDYYNVNRLHGQFHLNHLNQLMIYLLGNELGDDFSSSSALFQSILANAQYHEFKSEEYALPVRERVRTLFEQWTKRLFHTNPLLEEIQPLIQTLDDIEEARYRNQLAIHLSTLQTNLSRFEQALQQPQWQWVLDPNQVSPEIAKLYLTMADIPLLGKTFAAEMEDLNRLRYSQFRQELRRFQNHLIGTLIQPVDGTVPALPVPTNANQGNRPPTKSKDNELDSNFSVANNSILGLSPTLIGLKITLENFMSQPFMANSDKYYLQTQTPVNMQLAWHLGTLQDAIALNDSFNQYLKEELSKVQPPLQSILRGAGQVQLYQNLFALLVQAQQLKPQSPTLSQAEEVLRNDIQNFASAVPLLEQIINDLKGLTEDSPQVSQTINQLARSQAYNLLIKAEHLLTQDNLYTPLNETLTGWNGQQALSHTVFSVNDKTEMNYYLQLQRERVLYLAQTYVKPLMNIFLSKPLAGDTTGSIVVLKWQRILDELDKYTAKKTANSLIDLEKYILFELDKINLNSCVDTVVADQSGPSGDYFLQKRWYLQSLVSPQCQKLADKQAYERYSIISEFFNQKLAGRFPFASLDPLFLANTGNNENVATPDTVQEFFRLYAKYGQDLKEMLAHTYAFGANVDTAIKFLDKIEQVKIFFEPFLDKPLPWSDPLYEFTVEFRVNRDYELGANQIMAWQLAVARQPLPQTQTTVKGRWRLGDPLRLSVRWARNSAFRPYLDGMTAKSVLTLAARDTAVFEYNSDWALLELLQRQHSIASDFARLQDLQPYTLKLVIPVKQLVAQRRTGGEVANPEFNSSTASGSAPEFAADHSERGNISNINSDDLEREISLAENSTTASLVEGTPEMSSYQSRYRDWFEQTSQAMVFLRVTLLRPGQKEQLIIPEFPQFAPQLDQTQRLLPPPVRPLKSMKSIPPAPVTVKKPAKLSKKKR